MTLADTRSYPHNVADKHTPAEIEAVQLGDTQGHAHALVDTLADTLAEVKAMTLGDTWVNSHVLVDSLANTLAEVAAVRLGDTRAIRTHSPTL